MEGHSTVKEPGRHNAFSMESPSRQRCKVLCKSEKAEAGWGRGYEEGAGEFIEEEAWTWVFGRFN